MFDDQQHRFLIKTIGGYERPVKLTGDASSRFYYRVYDGSGKSYILCDDNQLKGGDIKSSAYFIVYHLFRKHGIAVPEVYAWDTAGFLLIQDLGDISLEGAYQTWSHDLREKNYRALLDRLVDIQAIPRDRQALPFTLSFDLNKLMAEFDFFTEHALCGYFNASLSQATLGELRREFMAIAQALQKPGRFVLNHRDFISRNIMVHGGALYTIDFQDARLGLPQYDLVSLLRDSAPVLDEALFSSLKAYYFHGASERGVILQSHDEYERDFDFMAFQRNVKIIGTFGYQAYRMKRERYVKYIKPSFGYLSGYAERRAELKRAYTLIADVMGAAL